MDVGLALTVAITSPLRFRNCRALPKNGKGCRSRVTENYSVIQQPCAVE
nr:MAG TPA: hypothetical protein [Caudoviricetes sp.]